MTLSGELDAVGSDADGTLQLEVADTSVKADVVIAGGEGYVRLPGRGWEKSESYRQAPPINTFLKLDTPEDLEYVGEVPLGGQRVHQLRTRKWIGDDPATLKSDAFSDASISSTTFEIFVRADGTPVEANLVFKMRGKSGGQDAEVTGSADYRFSNVGKKVTIEPPPTPLPGTLGYRYIRKTPNRVSGIGAFSAALIASARTSRV